MPLYVPRNLQGAGSATNVTLGATSDLLLEWGHFVDNPVNLLMVNGGIEVSTGEEAADITVTTTMDATTTIDERIVSVESGGNKTIAIGARLQNVAVGHHVFRVTAVSTSETSIASNRSAMSISGSPPA